MPALPLPDLRARRRQQAGRAQPRGECAFSQRVRVCVRGVRDQAQLPQIPGQSQVSASQDKQGLSRELFGSNELCICPCCTDFKPWNIYVCTGNFIQVLLIYVTIEIEKVPPF